MSLFIYSSFCETYCTLSLPEVGEVVAAVAGAALSPITNVLK